MTKKTEASDDDSQPVNAAMQALHAAQDETRQKAALAAAWSGMDTKLSPEQPPETATLDDAQASAIPADDRIAVTVRLKPRHYEYLTLRAQMNNRETAQELEAILRDFRSYHDPMRPDQAFIGPAEPGMPAAARRIRP